MIDEADRAGITIDVRHLVRELGVPVVPTAARSARGIGDLRASIELVARGPAPDGRPVGNFGTTAEKAATALAADLVRAFPGLRNSRWFALRLLEGDPWTEAAVRSQCRRCHGYAHHRQPQGTPDRDHYQQLQHL
jgi:ferrous iron transport protein B